VATEGDSFGEQDRLAQVLFECLQAVEAGEAPQALRDRYPEFAAEITEFLADRASFDHLVAPLREAVQAVSSSPGDRDRTAGSGWQDPLPEAGQWLGEFELLDVIGWGGMGIVYRARQPKLNRLVALKMIRADGSADPAEVRRFRTEAEVVAGLEHPSIVPVYEVGERDGLLYLSMRLVEGGTLADRLDGFTADPRAAARLVADTAWAVHFVHQRGILHRDLKPSNILLDREGQPHVSDFGLAKRLEADASLTQKGAIVGTPQYMAPEQTSGRKGAVTTATDVYGLGAVLYALLTGRPPFQGETVLETLEQVREREPEPPRRINAKVDRDLETICLKCLQKDPQRRYESAQALAEDLERWQTGEPIAARRPSPVQRLGRWVQRHPRTATTLATVALIAAAAWMTWDRQRLQAEAASRQVAEQAEALWRKGRLPEAEAVARRAADLLPRAGGDAGLKQRVGEMVADYTLLRRLDEARLHRVNHRADATTIDHRPTLAGFEAAFREEYGVDVLGGDEAVVLAELRRRAIRADLVAALDDWSVEMKDPAESLRLLKLANALDPDPQGIAARWRRLSVPGNVEELRKLAAEAERDPPPTAFLVRLGLTLIEASDRAAGLRLLRLAQRRRPDDIWALAVLVEQLLDAGPDHAAEAVGYLTAAQSLRPDSPVVLGNLGYALLDLGRYEDALDYFRMFQAIEPHSAKIHNNLGTALVRMKRIPEAVDEFRHAVALAPEDSQAWQNLGLALRDANRPADAVKALRKAVDLKKDASTFRVLTDVLNHLGRYVDAEAAGREAVKLDPRNAEGHFRLGLALMSQDRFADAAEAFRASNTLMPFPTTAFNLGSCLSRLKRWPEAEAGFRQAIQLDPKYALAHRELGSLLLERGDPGGAAESLRTAVQLGPKDADAFTTWGGRLAG
jgi:serine/threonine-protein kinase